MEAKTGAMDRLRPRRLIGNELPVHGSLREVPAHDRHGSSISFQEEVSAITLSVRAIIFQSEHSVGDDPKFQAAGHVNVPTERLTHLTVWTGKRELVLA